MPPTNGRDGLYSHFDIDEETKWVAASGYFDPMHVGHVNYIQQAKNLAAERFGDHGRLVVIVNNEVQSRLKNPSEGHLVPINSRVAVISALRYVDRVIVSRDTDRTVCQTLEYLAPAIFAKGGDRTSDEIPERRICDALGIEIVDGLGEKVESSSYIRHPEKRPIHDLEAYRGRRLRIGI
jgi:cytidyltransferase-like protein